MTGKEFLQHLLEMSRLLESQLEQFKRLQSIAVKITSVINGVPSIGNNSQSHIENAVVKVLQESTNIEKTFTAFLSLQEKASDAIKKISNNDERLILEYKYLAGKSWQEISKFLGLSLRYTYSLHGNALKSFEKIFELEHKKAQKSTNSTLTDNV